MRRQAAAWRGKRKAFFFFFSLQLFFFHSLHTNKKKQKETKNDTGSFYFISIFVISFFFLPYKVSVILKPVCGTGPLQNS